MNSEPLLHAARLWLDRHDWARPWLGIAAVLAAARVLLALVCFHHRRYRPPAEFSRKYLHLGMGVIFLACPWLFEAAWPVFLLAGVFIALLLARHLFPPLNYHVAGVIYGVRRQSAGEFYFPVAAALLIAVADGDPLLYCVPLSLLVFADAAAALVGRRYGQSRYRTADGEKSLEGSAAFCTVAFLCAHVLINLLAPGAGRGVALLTSCNLALAATTIEAVCSRGLDNLAVPLVAFLFLRIGLASSSRHLAILAGIQLIMTTALTRRVMPSGNERAFGTAAKSGA